MSLFHEHFNFKHVPFPKPTEQTSHLQAYQIYEMIQLQLATLIGNDREGHRLYQKLIKQVLLLTNFYTDHNQSKK